MDKRRQIEIKIRRSHRQHDDMTDNSSQTDRTTDKVGLTRKKIENILIFFCDDFSFFVFSVVEVVGGFFAFFFVFVVFSSAKTKKRSTPLSLLFCCYHHHVIVVMMCDDRVPSSSGNKTTSVAHLHKAHFTKQIKLNLTAMERFEMKSPLGAGGYGTVYRAYDKKLNIFVAVKKYKVEENRQGIQSTTLREIAILHRLRHPNIVELHNVIRKDDNRLYVVYECMDMDLEKYMKSIAGPLDPELICSYTSQLLTALDFCHSRATMHR